MLACAIALAAVAVIAFAPGSTPRALREGAPGTYWVLGAGVVGLVAFIARAWRGRPMHTAWWVACLALPQIAALAASIRAGRYIDAAMDGMVGDVVARIVAEGTAELTLAMTLADLFTVACAATIAIGLASTLVSDEPRPDAKRVLVPGGAWVAASIVLFAVALSRHELALEWVAPLLVTAMVAIAVVCRGSHELTGRVAVLAIFCIFMLHRAISLRARASAFAGVSMEDATPLDQARLLAEFVAVKHHVAIAMMVHLVLGLVTFFAAFGVPRRSMLPAGIVLILVAATAARERRAFLRRMEAVKSAFDVGVTIPSTRAKSGWPVYGNRFVVTRAGALTETVTQRSMQEEEEPVSEGEHFSIPSRSAKPVFADSDLACGALVAALRPKVRARQAFALGAVRSRIDGPRPFVGDLDPLVGDHELVGLGFDLADHYAVVVDAILASDALVVKLPGEPALTFPLASDPGDVARAIAARRPETLSKRDTVQLTVHASDTVRRLAAALTMLTVAFPFADRWQHRYFALRIE